MRWPAASLLLLAAAAALGCCASAAADVTVAGGHRRDGLLLLRDSTRTQDGRRLQPQQPQHQQSGPFARLMLKKGGISQSKYAPLITEALGTAIITTTVGLLSKSDVPGALSFLFIPFKSIATVGFIDTRTLAAPPPIKPATQGACRASPSAPSSCASSTTARRY